MIYYKYCYRPSQMIHFQTLFSTHPKIVLENYPWQKHPLFSPESKIQQEQFTLYQTYKL